MTSAVGLARPVIQAVGVGKRVGAGPTAVQALSEIDLTVQDGEFITLIGRSGCGKSTLLRLIGDLLDPTTGDIQVNAKPARQARLDRDYGMVFQAPVLMDWRSIAANIELPLEIQGLPGNERSRRSAELLHLVELDGVASSHPWQLSGGMQQRAAIARALASAPGLLLMDEPFGALDEMTRERLNLELIKIWAVTGTTIVFVTHSISEAVFLSMRVVVMSSQPGRISRIVEIDLPQPRTTETRDMVRYAELVGEVRAAIRANPAAPLADQ